MSSAPKKTQTYRIQQQPQITKEEPIPFLVYNSTTRSKFNTLNNKYI